MIELRRRQILVDGAPRIVMCGEVHYFRVARDEWPARVRALKEAGCTAVASYIPWLVHELPDGSIDVTGTSRPERDVAAFIDLCRDEGLWFVARPGPFVMAELKNEGLPYRIYTEHPEIVPVGWDGRPAPTRTVDYLAPAFLDEVHRWYDAVMPIIAERLQPFGGNVIAVQLDNEVGMLAWVSNSPDLTDDLLADLLHWLHAEYGAGLADRYPVDLSDAPAWAAAVRSPGEEWAATLRVDLGHFMRNRFSRYVTTLRGYAEAAGVHDVPFLVNIHGTDGGDGAPFPIGISQLVETYAGTVGMIGGSDHYVGDMTLGTTTDLYVMNAFLDAVNGPDQPNTSLEFEAGSGDYSGGLDLQYDPSTVDLKTRLFVAQGNRIINYYLFAGGINPPLDEAVGDGNDRISFTGERHGTAAPIGPEGQRGPTYAPTARAVAAVNANEPWLARMREEHDDLSLAFLPDAYLTEYHHPDSAVMSAVVQDLTAHRGAGPRKALARSLLLAGYRFGAVDLQRAAPDTRVLALATGVHLDEAVQRRLLTHLDGGGGLLLLGRLPVRDLYGRPCTLLADALGLRPGRLVHGTDRYYPSLRAHSWATAARPAGSLPAAWPETRVGWLEQLVHGDGEPVLTDVADDGVCGIEVTRGAGRAVVLTAELPSDPALFRAAAERLGVTAGLRHDASVPGVFTTSTVAEDGSRLLHLLNVSGYPAALRLSSDGRPLFDGRVLTLAPRSGRMLPVGLRLPAATVAWSTAEITAATDRSVSVDLRQDEEVVVLETDREVRAEGADTHRDAGRVTVTARRDAVDGATLTIDLD
ncbi:MAG: beta-galactosidase [Actinocatenispora sp.]